MSLLLRHRMLSKKDGGINPDYLVFEFALDAGEFTLPNINSPTGYNGEINYGDSSTWYSFTTHNDVGFTHTYTSAGTYLIMIRGSYHGLNLYQSPVVTNITRVVQWGNVGLASLFDSFYGATNLVSVPSMAGLSGSLGSTGNTFRGCTNLESDIITPPVTSLGGYFIGATGKIKTITLNSNLQTIGGDFARQAGGEGSLTIPSGVTSIGARSFYLCSGFNGTLTVPAGVSTLPGRVFEGCSGFNNVLMYPTTAPTITLNDMNLGGTPRPLHVPVGASGYDVSPWTNTSIFSSVIYDL